MERDNSIIRNLIDKLNYYTKKYDEGNPEISDKEWDDLYFELVKLENEKCIYFEDSPTQRINYQVVNKLDKIKHNHLMLSLDKTKDINEIYSFIGNKKYICMSKMDGLTCSLKYINGKLVSAETRGNGQIGEDILHNAFVVKNIPNKISFTDELIIDGEIICTYKNFELFSDEYKNPRNFASGSIRLLDSEECSKRRLSFVAWDCIKGLESEEYLSNKLIKLKKLGFIIVPFISNEKKIENTIEKIKNESQKLFYPIDGVVFKYDNVQEYEKAGKTDHHFKGGMAYKFYDEMYETKLENVEWTMGRTGVLTPIAIFNTIDIDGTEVSRASLHNVSIMEKTLHKTNSCGWKGQKLQIFKANQIIPQIGWAEKDIDGLEKEYIDFPHACPICGGKVEIWDNSESSTQILMCINPNCEGKLINKLEHMLGKKGLDAKGISKATLEKLINFGWIKQLRDVFILQSYAEEWKNIKGFGEKSVSNILQSISNCTNCNLESVISAAGIPLIGRTVAKTLSKRFSSYNTFREAIDGDFDFESIGGFGYEMNKSLKTFDYTEMDYIVNNYLHIENNIEENKSNSKVLNNLTFCITGKLKEYKNRDELIKFIENNGGKVVSTISKNVNYLINNDINSTSSKNKKAKEYGIPIISEVELKQMI